MPPALARHYGAAEIIILANQNIFFNCIFLKGAAPPWRPESTAARGRRFIGVFSIEPVLSRSVLGRESITIAAKTLSARPRIKA